MSFREILEKRAADIIMPDFQKTGGLLEARKSPTQLQFADWVEFFSQNYFKPPIRAAKTHEMKRTSARPCILNAHSNSAPSAILHPMTSSFILDVVFRGGFNSRPRPGLFRKIC
jgi:L-alanine-DL-glutamate epimerase-like enolase superfamily enzyme